MKEIGLYLHIPFCIKKCRYCDFVSYNKNRVMIDAYIDALIKEMDMYGNRLEEYKVKSIFIGGGTPSILDIRKFDEIIKGLHRNFNISRDIEFTTESNPGTLTKEKLEFYNSVGINRLSMGLQSLNNDILKFIGRIHTKEEFMENYYSARNAGFKNMNIDLIYGLPGQSLKDWEATLKGVMQLKPEHISAYSLKIEEGTAFNKLYEEGKLSLPSDEEDREMYHLAINLLSKKGIEQYEISNFSRVGYECRHNLIYWNNEEYLGMGVSAHSYKNRNRCSNTNDIKEYIDYISKHKLPIVNEELKNKKDEIAETIFLGLRLNKGLDMSSFFTRFGMSIFELYGEKIDKLVSQGLLIIENNHIKLTSYGMDISNQVFVEFL
ncbi:MAG: radical SAM family heme chaperone HemW [Maledivibacter sp.]|jgi:oxygen-independent coproporphyrinogen-3 oxidase|nr:radical SAM family heme chaperone HemW [Maledivibacter sp.]